MKINKKFLLSALLLLLVFILIPGLASAWAIGDPLVPAKCNAWGCGITDFFTMLVNVYSFIVLLIATPAAVIAITFAAILMMVSAGNPGLMGRGKQILIFAIIGLVLSFGSYLIINSVLGILGFSGNWDKPF